MSSTEYGSLPRSDEEAHTVEQTRWQKCRSHLGKHGHRIFIAWFIIILVAAVLTLSFHFSLIPSHHEQPADGDDDLVNMQCTSDRSWLLTLLLSIFFGCFGKYIHIQKGDDGIYNNRGDMDRCGSFLSRLHLFGYS